MIVTSSPLSLGKHRIIEVQTETEPEGEMTEMTIPEAGFEGIHGMRLGVFEFTTGLNRFKTNILDIFFFVEELIKMDLWKLLESMH